MELTQGVRFDALGLTEEVQRALKKKNIEESTPVQAGCIPPMREWKDVIAKAPTGTGKTFAFGIPIIEHIEPGSEETEAVILAPTRELAMQITSELRDLCVYLPGVRIVCLYGGAPIGKQIDALKKHPQIVVATPGRLSDHMKRRTVKLDNVKTVVLDEADRMLDMGFIHDVTRILDKLKSRRNLGMFSATISREVMDISWMYQRDPEEITVQAREENKPDIAQYRIDVGQNDKTHVMAQIIRAEGHERVMAFCNTKGMAERLKAFLMMEGLDVDCIHGDIPQKKREAVMARFRRGELPVFVATDVAARGIDVDDVDAVFNYDVPLENEYYVHRIGRTGRAGELGWAITFVTEQDVDEFYEIEKLMDKTADIYEAGDLHVGPNPPAVDPERDPSAFKVKKKTKRGKSKSKKKLEQARRDGKRNGDDYGDVAGRSNRGRDERRGDGERPSRPKRGGKTRVREGVQARVDEAVESVAREVAAEERAGAAEQAPRGNRAERRAKQFQGEAHRRRREDEDRGGRRHVEREDEGRGSRGGKRGSGDRRRSGRDDERGGRSTRGGESRGGKRFDERGGREGNRGGERREGARGNGNRGGAGRSNESRDRRDPRAGRDRRDDWRNYDDTREERRGGYRGGRGGNQAGSRGGRSGGRDNRGSYGNSRGGKRGGSSRRPGDGGGKRK